MINGKNHRQPNATAFVSEATRQMASDPSRGVCYESYKEEKDVLVSRLQHIEQQLSATKDELARVKMNSLNQRWSEKKYISIREPIDKRRQALMDRKFEITSRLSEIKEFAKRENRAANSMVMRDDGSVDLVSLVIEVRQRLAQIESLIRGLPKAAESEAAHGN